MAIKKSQLYSALGDGCDELRGAERLRVSDQSALAQREESSSGAAISGVRKGALCPGGRSQAF